MNAVIAPKQQVSQIVVAISPQGLVAHTQVKLVQRTTAGGLGNNAEMFTNDDVGIKAGGKYGGNKGGDFYGYFLFWVLLT